MQGFNGFPDGKNKPLSLPGLFFSELLPLIDHLGEMKVTLYCFWAMHQQEDEFRYVRFSEVLADRIFMDGIKANGITAEAALRDSFERAVARGTLLHALLVIKNQSDDLYFINTEKGRKALEALEKGDWLPGDQKRPIELIIERPNLFVLYEQNIGAITPLIADQLRDAEQEYPAEWLTEAIQIAVNNNARSLRYILRILEQWATKGKQRHGVAGRNPEKSRFAHLEEDYSDIIQS